MFRKVIVFGLFEMIQKKVRTASPGPGSASGSGRVRRLGPSQCFYWTSYWGIPFSYRDHLKWVDLCRQFSPRR